MNIYMWTHLKKIQYTMAAGDAVAVLIPFFLCLNQFVGYIASSLCIAVALILVILQLVIFDLCELYNIYYICNTNKYSDIRKAVSAVSLLIMVSICIIVIIYIYYKCMSVLLACGLYALMVLVFLVTWRYIVAKYIVKAWKPTRVSIMATEDVVEFIESGLRYIPLLSLSTLTLLSSRETDKINEDYQDPDLQKRNRIVDFLKDRDFDILAFDSSKGLLDDREIEEILKLPADGKQVYDLFAVYESLTGKVPLRRVDGQWLLNRSEFQTVLTRTYTTIKRFLDVFVSALALTLLMPLMVLIGVAVKGGSRGPVFFVQDRLGRNFSVFSCYKFRTMIEGAEDKYGQVWASEGDPRVTAIGRFLRVSRLDELPQLWNVLKGDMTLVGPRPIRESFARELEEHIPFYRLRFCVKPGLTGWAQVNFDYAGSIEGQFEKFQYDLFYIENMSFLLDLLILFKTIRTVVRQRGT